MTDSALDEISHKGDIVLGPHDEFIGIEADGEAYKDGLKYESFDEIPDVEIMTPLSSVDKQLQNRIFLTGFKTDSWTEEHTMYILTEFVPANGADVIFCAIQPNGSLYIGSSIPTFLFQDLNYFMRTREGMNVEITPSNFNRTVQNGSVLGQGMESLLRIMTGIYAPTFFTDRSWPDSIKNDFALQLHRFMSALTDTRWKMSSKTVLYVPMEGVNHPPADQIRDKDLISRLEMIAIHWTRQIKEVLSSQSTLDDDERAGPLDEIEFWRNRCDDLIGISKQLDNKNILTIAKTLTLAKSSYIAPFIKLSEEIKSTSKEAQDNLKFLITMKDIFINLTELTPSQIPSILPDLINQIRMIWTNSKYYKSKEVITGLFRKVSNEIIQRCSHIISLDDIFDGRIRSASLQLQDCINCCEQYRTIYFELKELHLLFSDVPWDTEDANIFAQIDAFIKRCKDLLEICEGQADFGRFVEGNKAEMPIFPGVKGLEVVTLIVQIENMFAKMIANLSDKRSVILDIKATTWHDHYNRFCSGVKDLEIMMKNAISMAFETVTTIQQGVEVLDIFAHLQKREAIRRTLESSARKIIEMFLNCISRTRQEIVMRPMMGLSRPRESKYAINVIFWRYLRRRLSLNLKQLDLAFFLQPIATILEEYRGVYEEICLNIEEMTAKMFNDFVATIDTDPLKSLETPILTRSPLKPEFLEATFPGSVLSLINELDQWLNLGMEIPHYSSETHRRRSELRYLREIVLLLTREYNRIVRTLNAEEKALFQERIRALDKKMVPGFVKVQWPVKSMVEFFVNDTRLQICNLQIKVDEYMIANADIRKNCESIAKTLLIKVESGRIYENDDFNVEQIKHRATTSETLLVLHNEIIEKLMKVKETFASEVLEVQTRWYSYVERMDHFCQEAFRLNVKSSLSELRQVINGDGRNDPSPFYKIILNLDGSSLVFIPSVPQLTDVIISLGGLIIGSFAEIPRLTDILTRTKRTTKQSIATSVLENEEIVKIQESIKKGTTDIAKPIQDPLAYWDKFREIWEKSKDEVIDHYRAVKINALTINDDIARYAEVINKVQEAEAMVTVRFLQLDFSLLKNAIAAHCREWQTRLINLLMEMTVEALGAIYDYMSEMTARLSRVPESLTELSQAMSLLEKVQSEEKDMEDKFAPIEEQFAILDKCEVTYDTEISTKRINLYSDWLAFKDTIFSCEELIRRTRDKFKMNLLGDLEKLRQQIKGILVEVQKTSYRALGPPPSEALTACQSFRDRLTVMLGKEDELRNGLRLFKLEQPPCKESALIQRELDLLEEIWTLNKEWEENWMQWKLGRFSELQTDDMDEFASTMLKKISRITRENKVNLTYL
nr:dynein heavy chain [Hymenolepis microstoma]